jgi:hypothetical protein
MATAMLVFKYLAQLWGAAHIPYDSRLTKAWPRLQNYGHNISNYRHVICGWD